MVPGLGRNLPRQAGQRGQSLTCQVCREPQGSGGPRRGSGAAGAGLPRGGVAKGQGAEGRGARPSWPLKGRSSWGGHFNRPQLNHCRKLLTAPYSLSRTVLLLGSQAVMQKERGLGPLTTHPGPQGQPAPNSSQPPKRLLVCESKAGEPALIWGNPALPGLLSFSPPAEGVGPWGPPVPLSELILGVLGACPCLSLPEAGLLAW